MPDQDDAELKRVKPGDGGVVDGCGWQGEHQAACPSCGSKMLRLVQKKLPEHMAETLSGDGKTRQIDLWYPRVEGNPRFVELGLMDVRAADSIRVSYDFKRDGWKIEQASTFEWTADDKVCDPDWQEVAFIQAWNREREPTISQGSK